jgi:hypothetical protein
MKISEVLPKGYISEVYFRYHPKIGRYTNLSSDIPKLYEIAIGEVTDAIG